MSQVNQVRRHLEAGNKITPLQALRQFGAMRLAHIIYKLRQQGYNIVTDRRHQGGKYYAVYYLDTD